MSPEAPLTTTFTPRLWQPPSSASWPLSKVALVTEAATRAAHPRRHARRAPARAEPDPLRALVRRARGCDRLRRRRPLVMSATTFAGAAQFASRLGARRRRDRDRGDPRGDLPERALRRDQHDRRLDLPRREAPPPCRVAGDRRRVVGARPGAADGSSGRSSSGRGSSSTCSGSGAPRRHGVGGVLEDPNALGLDAAFAALSSRSPCRTCATPRASGCRARGGHHSRADAVRARGRPDRRGVRSLPLGVRR